jgi:hypothetical protein
LSYVGNQNRHQNDGRETNLPNPSVLPGLINGTVTYNTVVPYLGFHSILLSEMAENSHYNSLQVNFHSRIQKNLSLQLTYTLSRSMDPAVSFGGDNTNTDNPYNRAYDWGPAMVDRTHIVLINFIYDIPAFRHAQSHALRSTLGGWQLSGTGMMQTGLPILVTLGGSQGSNGLANSTNRPNVNGSISYPQSVTQWFDTSVFSTPTLGQWGNLGKGAVRGPGRNNWNISLFKSFLLNEQRNSRFEFRIETFNTFNHTEFNNVSTSFSASNFGQVTSVSDPRTFQFGAKLLF